MKTINSFKGEYRFLSNFYPSPIRVDAGKIWPTVEHLYQASKTLDKKERELIRLADTPGKAKRLGRRATIREDWKQIEYTVMVNCVRLKFSQNKNLAKMLLATNEAVLIEGNWWHDNNWGDCQCKNCKNIIGKNLHGKALMQVRSELFRKEG